MAKPINLDGQRFGSLTVEHITDQRNSYGKLLYICRCDCGNTRLATAANLKRGEVLRCKACKGKTRMKDISGKRFGKLTAIKPVEEKERLRGTYKWLCKCDCGNYATVPLNKLTTGNTKSCGCIRQDIKERLYRSSVSQIEPPKSPRGTARNEKKWKIKSPDGTVFEFCNLRKWAREHYMLIDPETCDPERTAINFAYGISNVKRTKKNPEKNFKSKAFQYKGWTVIIDGEEKEEEHGV